jgi:hypothetical protein
MGGPGGREALERNASLDEICGDFAAAEAAFAGRARGHLLYTRRAGPLSLEVVR